jgi:hypothetical protein
VTTPQNTRAEILADLWLNYRDDEEFKDFIAYNDLGLPLAYMITTNIVQSTAVADNFINETFDLLLAAMETEDAGFDSLDDLLGFESGDLPE